MLSLIFAAILGIGLLLVLAQFLPQTGHKSYPDKSFSSCTECGKNMEGKGKCSSCINEMVEAREFQQGSPYTE